MFVFAVISGGLYLPVRAPLCGGLRGGICLFSLSARFSAAFSSPCGLLPGRFWKRRRGLRLPSFPAHVCADALQRKLIEDMADILVPFIFVFFLHDIGLCQAGIDNVAQRVSDRHLHARRPRSGYCGYAGPARPVRRVFLRYPVPCRL